MVWALGSCYTVGLLDSTDYLIYTQDFVFCTIPIVGCIIQLQDHYLVLFITSVVSELSEN